VESYMWLFIMGLV